MITQFKGEDRREAIVNYFSLDIEEDDLFFKYVESMGYSVDDEDDILENLFKMWDKSH